VKDERRCRARAKTTGERCRKAALKDMVVCRSHGGAAGQSRAAAARRRAEKQAAAVLTARGQVVPIYEPLETLAEVAGEVVALKDYLRNQVDALNGVLTYSYASGEIAGLGQSREDVRAVVAAYERALDRAARVLAVMAKLDLTGQLLPLRTRKAELIIAAIDAGLATATLSGSQIQQIKSAIADELAKITASDEKITASDE
jgi:hypothetical protein